MRSSRTRSFLDEYTRDLTTADVQRLFTRDTAEAYRYFTRHADPKAVAALPWYRRWPMRLRLVFTGFTMRLSPPRRALYAAGVLAALIGAAILFRGFAPVRLFLFPFSLTLLLPAWVDGTVWLLVGFVAVNLLILMEVADRLSLKGELEIARDIQLAMLPSGERRVGDTAIAGITRPANTVGGDFYDILPLDDGRLVITLGDVAGKGSPAALLMALLLAMLRTLVDEKLEPADLITRLNVQVCRHAPGTRFITLFYGVFDPRNGSLTYVSAGHMPPLLLRADGTCERLSDGGISLGMFEHSTYTTGHVVIQPDDLFAVYSDGITEAESQQGVPFDEIGLETALKASHHASLADVGAAVVRAVERHTDAHKFADDLTILVLRRCITPAAAGV
jgi:serine phosphatase RsbU (regulator of sigma subunit)